MTERDAMDSIGRLTWTCRECGTVHCQVPRGGVVSCCGRSWRVSEDEARTVEVEPCVWDRIRVWRLNEIVIGLCAGLLWGAVFWGALCIL